MPSTLILGETLGKAFNACWSLVTSGPLDPDLRPADGAVGGTGSIVEWIVKAPSLNRSTGETVRTAVGRASIGCAATSRAAVGDAIGAPSSAGPDVRNTAAGAEARWTPDP